MLRFLLCSLLLAALALPALAQPTTTAEAPLSDRRVAYTIDATLDPATRTVLGRQRLTWRHPGRVPVGELQFHLYLNAFKPGSTFMRESGGRHRGFEAGGENPWGGIEITRMQIAAPDAAASTGTYSSAERDLTPRLRFIHPDDDNLDDETVVEVTLPEPVQPGETVVLDIDFEARLPKIVARTGWAEKPNGTPFFMVAQWFPKIGVYEIPGQRYIPRDAPRGQWYTHQFHANSEFYADFGTYDVTITTPADYIVGATGVRVSETQNGADQTLTYRADDVHDFAWTASPAFREYTDQWRHVALRLLVQPEHAGQAERHFEAAKIALERFDAWVGEYPYTTLTLVDGIGGSNGMEYPTLITCGTVYALPAWARFLELVTIHELGHQYFYGLLASNEAEEAWLDEGINSYLEARIIDEAYGAAFGNFLGLHIPDEALQRTLYVTNAPRRAPIFRRSWEYTHSSDYGINSYAKPATVLFTLERYLGWETMREILRTYYERWRFRHPTTRDFIAVAEDVSGEDLSWFFDQFVYGTVAVDYAVEGISNEEQEDGTFESTVGVERKEEGVIPQTLRVRFEDGTVEDLAWDGEEEWKTFRFEAASPVAEAYLDPENRVPLDLDRLNNRRLATPDDLLARKQQLKATVWFQQLFYLVAGLL